MRAAIGLSKAGATADRSSLFSGFGRASFWYENSILTSGIPKIGSEPIRARQLQKNGLGGAGTQYDF